MVAMEEHSDNRTSRMNFMTFPDSIIPFGPVSCPTKPE
jgi:hypothetical protein